MKYRKEFIIKGSEGNRWISLPNFKPQNSSSTSQPNQIQIIRKACDRKIKLRKRIKMINLLKETLWNQFGASIDMLENAIAHCPTEYWDTEKKFWYNAFHCLFFLDYYLTLDPKKFSPPAPFTLSEFEDGMPERVYTKDELLTYLSFCRQKCHGLISRMTEEIAATHWVNQSGTMDYTVAELLMYNMRHVQHHAGQLNLILRQDLDDAPRWVSRAKLKL